MYPKISKVKGKRYLRIMESVREGNKVKQKTVVNFGNVDNYTKKDIIKLVDSLLRIFEIEGYEKIDDDLMEEIARRNYGIRLIINKIFDRYEMKRYFEKMNTTYDIEEMLKIMVMNRIIEPKSKLGIFNNLEYYGYTPVEVSEGKELEKDEVMLHWLYRTLDVLAENKEGIEKHLYNQRINLFNTRVDLVFYDVTTLAFETQQTNELLQMGYSKDKKFNESQIVLGMSIDQDKMPVSFDIYPGNTFEGHTFKDAVETMKKEYQLGKVIVVSDRGMMSKKNIEVVENSNYEFIVGKSIKQLKKIDIFDGEFIEIARGIKYREVQYDNNRLLIIYSEERAKKDRADRLRLIEKAKKMLENNNIINKRGAKKYLKEENKQNYILDIEKIQNDEKYDGYYGIMTNTKLNPKQILEQYHTLWKVEETFRTLKNYLETRPIFHWTPKRIKGHIVMSFISYIMQRTLELELEKNNIEYSHEKIREAIKNMEYSEVRLKDKLFALRANLNDFQKSILKTLEIEKPKKMMDLGEFKEKYF